MSTQPAILSVANYGQVKSANYDLAVLPWGATEPHNYHLPYGTDNYETDAIADRACQRAADAGAKIIRLPTIPFGVQTTQQEFPLAINMNPTTQLAVLADVAESVANSNIPKLVILNGHGGNDFYWMLRELYGQIDLFMVTVSWFTLGDMSIFTGGGDHANEMETSLCLHLVPELVADLSTADDGHAREFRIELMRQGKAKTPRPWHLLTESTGVGDPHNATAEKGKSYFDAVTRELANFFIELAKSPMDETFPFQ